MSTPITTREELTRIRWFVMSAYKNEKKAEEALKGKNGLEYFIPKHYAVRVYHGMKSKRLSLRLLVLKSVNFTAGMAKIS